MISCDVCIVGGGPGGLSCAALLARHGAKVTLLERNLVPGKKVCAGGITWNGLLDKMPDFLVERSFSDQIIKTPRNKVRIAAPHPLIGTVNRERFGQYLADKAAACGAQILFGARVHHIANKTVSFRDQGHDRTLSCNYLVGADGSHSRVRSFLGLPTHHIGLGINYTLPYSSDEMVWNFDARRFGCGYSWLFPHRETVSAGVYSGIRQQSSILLKRALQDWLRERRLPLLEGKVQADLVNHDYRGWKFQNCFLVGDAAGLASPLTGEGIYPAVISGEAAAQSILGRDQNIWELQAVIKKHHKHRMMLHWAAFNPLFASVLAELSALLLRSGFLSWKTFEMA